MLFRNKTTTFLIVGIFAALNLFAINRAYADTPPAAITDLAGIPGDGSVTLGWTTPSGNGFAITDYSVQFEVDGTSSWSTFSHAPLTTNNITVTGLTDGTLYDFQVAAINSGGTATYSNIAESKPLPLQNTDGFESYTTGSNINSQGGWATNGSLWKVTSSGETGQGLLGGPGTNDPATDIANYATQRFSDSIISVDFKAESSGDFPGLFLRNAASATAPGDGYQIATPDGGNTLWLYTNSPTSGQTFLRGGTAPTMLTVGDWYRISFQVVNNSAGHPVLSLWEYPVGSEPGAAILTYTDSTNAYMTGFAGLDAQVGSGTSTYTFDNVQINGTEVNQVPDVPTSLNAASADSSVQLSWVAPYYTGGTSTPLTDYSIQYRVTGTSSWTTFSHTPITGNTILVTGLTSGTGYDFQIAGENSIGTGAYSAVATGEPLSLRKSDDFGSYALNSSLNGQGGWIADSGIWTVGAGESGQGVVNGFNGTPDFLLNYGAEKYTDSLISADFEATAGTTIPTLWLRSTSVSGSGSGYDLWSPDGGTTWCPSSTGSIFGCFTDATTPTPGNFYTVTFAVINNSAGHPVLYSWENPVGATLGQPLGVRTDTGNTFQSGFAAIGGNGQAGSIFDNVHIFGDPIEEAPGAITTLDRGVGDSSVSLTWNAPVYIGGQPTTSYSVQYRVTGNSSWTVFGQTANTTLTVTGLTNGTSYDFDVLAMNSNGTSSNSNIVTGTPTAGVISISDPNLYWSPYNWKFDGSSWAENAVGGGYVKVAFSGTQLGIYVDTSQNAGETLSLFLVDAYVDGATTPITVNLSQANSNGLLQISNSLSSGSHYAVIYFAQSPVTGDRWVVPSESLRITGIQITGTTQSLSTTPIVPSTKKLIFYGDSMSEGLFDSGDEYAYDAIMARDLGYEYGQVAYSGVGFVAPSNNVPGLYSTGTGTAGSMWRNYDATKSRLVDNSNLSSGYIGGNPDAVFVDLGTNDARTAEVVTSSTVSEAALRVAISDWITDERATVGPNTPIIFMIEPHLQALSSWPSAYQSVFPTYLTYVEAGVSDYATAHPNDTNFHVVELSELQAETVLTTESGDGLHPTDAGQVDFANDWVALVSQYTNTPGVPTGVSAVEEPSGATVSFSAPSFSGGTPITGYTVISNPSGGVDAEAGSTALTHTITGLTNSVSYTFTVTATNAFGTGAPSSASNAVVPANSGGGGGGGAPGQGGVFGNTPTVPTIPNTPTPAQFNLSTATLVNQDGTYFLLDGTAKYGITSPGILGSYGYTFGESTQATALQAALPITSNLPPNSGALVKTVSDPTVYLISNGQRFGFASANVFKALGYKFSLVLTVTTPELDLLSVAAPITDGAQAHQPGTNLLLNGTVYYVGTDNTLHPYPSVTVYNTWNIPNDFSTVVQANAADQALPIGTVEIART